MRFWESAKKSGDLFLVVTFEEYRKIALAFQDATEQPHFDHPSFRYKNKIFATYWTNDHKAMVKLSLEDQSVFCAYEGSVFYPVEGAWGKKGATFVNLAKVKKSMFKDALTCAYSTLVNSGKPKKSASKK